MRTARGQLFVENAWAAWKCDRLYPYLLRREAASANNFDYRDLEAIAPLVAELFETPRFRFEDSTPVREAISAALIDTGLQTGYLKRK